MLNPALKAWLCETPSCGYGYVAAATRSKARMAAARVLVEVGLCYDFRSAFLELRRVVRAPERDAEAAAKERAGTLPETTT
jgi:hypothetical protein